MIDNLNGEINKSKSQFVDENLIAKVCLYFVTIT